MLPWASHPASYTAVILHPGSPPPRRRLGHLPARQAQRAAVLRRNLAHRVPAGTGASALWFRAVLRKAGLRLRFAPARAQPPASASEVHVPSWSPQRRGIVGGGTCRRFLVNPDWAGQSHPKTPARAGVTLRKEGNVYRHWNGCSYCNYRPGHLDAAPPLTAPPLRSMSLAGRRGRPARSGHHWAAGGGGQGRTPVVEGGGRGRVGSRGLPQ
jgi:hypothetical protein